jgi:hypothetical protein
MLSVKILPADIQDRDGCLPVLKEVRRLFPFLQRFVADGAYPGTNTDPHHDAQNRKTLAH